MLDRNPAQNLARRHRRQRFIRAPASSRNVIPRLPHNAPAQSSGRLPACRLCA
jgi:hypothetical protein